MDIAVEQLKGSVPVTVLHIAGDVDIHSYQTLEDTGREVINNGADRVLLDLSSVAYISSAGLRAIHAIYAMLNGGSDSTHDETVSRGLRDGSFKSKQIKLLNPTAPVQQVLHMTGFDMFLEVHHDLGQALASFQ